MARVADGTMIATYNGTAWMSGTPIARSVGSIAFGPDGALYTWESRGLVRTWADRSVDVLGSVYLHGFMPDGSLIHRNGSAFLKRDVNTGLDTLLVANATALAARADGGIVWAAPGGRILTHGPEGPVVLAAVPAHVSAMAFDGTDLYVAVSSYPYTTISVIDLGIEGFGGFRPAFTPAPLPDLVITSIDEVRTALVDEAGVRVDAPDPKRTVAVTVTNAGPGIARGPISVTVHPRDFDASIGLFPILGKMPDAGASPTLGPGESAVVTLTFDGSVHTGSWRIVLDTGGPYADTVIESDEANNEAIYRPSVV